VFREKFWTIVAVFILLAAVEAIIFAASVWLIAILEGSLAVGVIALIVTLILVPIAAVVIKVVPKAKPFPIMTSLLERPRRPAPYSHYPPPQGPYYVYGPAAPGPPQPWHPPSAPYQYQYAAPPIYPSPPGVAPPPTPMAPQAPAGATRVGYGRPPEDVRGVVVDRRAPAVGPAEGPAPSIGEPPAGPDRGWEEVEEPTACPGVVEGAPEERADRRPCLAIFRFHYFLLGFLVATAVGTLGLAYRDTGPVWIDQVIFLCFLISFSFPSLMWISFVHHRRVREPETREGILIALTAGMLATVPPLFINTLVAAVNPVGAVVAGAPIVEELTKALALLVVIQEINSRYDGLIYGVTVGMGFAMVENLAYGMSFIGFEGAPDAIAANWGALTLVRGLASTIGHAVGVGLVGYVLGAFLDPESDRSMLPIAGAYLAAVGIHAGWNGLVVAAELVEDPVVFGALVAGLVAWPLFELSILLLLIRRGQARGEHYIGGGHLHKEPPPAPPPAPVPQPFYPGPAPMRYGAPPPARYQPGWPPQPPPY
jgi:RsiW-degrading membrane proteinase PrsW (M82 family)